MKNFLVICLGTLALLLVGALVTSSVALACPGKQVNLGYGCVYHGPDPHPTELTPSTFQAFCRAWSYGEALHAPGRPSRECQLGEPLCGYNACMPPYERWECCANPPRDEL